MGDFSDIRYEVRGGQAWLTIDRPERRNALRRQTVEELREALRRAAEDREVRVVCLTGTGDEVFCAGADLKSVGQEVDQDPMGLEAYAHLLAQMHRHPTPLVARVAGHCLGGGLGLVLACDVAYAADDIELGTPEVSVGLFPMMVAALLPRGASEKKVLEMVFSGAKISAAEAEAMGLISRRLARASLDEAVEELLSRIATRAPLALRWGRRAWRETEQMPVEAALDHLRRRLEDLMATEDAMEGMRAFAERRRPKWSGR